MAVVNLLITFIGLLHVCVTVAEISSTCLQCICHVEGCESEIGKCREDVGSLSCGPFQIKEAYWDDCGRPGGDYETCAKQMECSEECVRAYTKRYTAECTGGRTPTCQDYSRVHNGGPEGCRKSDTIPYWERVEKCCGPDCSSIKRHDQSFSAVSISSETSMSVYMKMMLPSRSASLWNALLRRRYKKL